MLSLVLCCILLAYLAYRYLTSNYDYWRKRNVPYEKPTLVFGSFKDVAFMKRNFAQFLEDLHHQYPNSPYVGFFKMRTPCLLLTKPELIEQAFVHDSDFFWMNEFTVDADVDPIAARGPFFQIGQKWKTSRGLFTPLVSSAKMKHATPFFVQAADKMLTFIDENKVCETRDLLTRYVADASALSAFGIDGESFEKDDAFFRRLGQKLMEPDGFTGLKLLCMAFMPRLAKLLNFKFIPDESVDYMSQMISTALKHRKENNINNNDFLDSIVAMKSDTFTDIDVVAWAFGFFSDPNASNQGSYILYCLAKNPEIQKKLKFEIDDVLDRHNGEVTYDAVQEMSYLDCVISETLRMYPSLHGYMKRCTGYYEFPLDEAQKEVVCLHPGMSLAFSIVGMHHDERYFERPEEFLPERFSEKNRGKIPKGAYNPFGLGKRMCAGRKFAMALMKISTVIIIKTYELTVNEKTAEPLELNPRYVLAVPKSGLWINFARRN